MESKCMSCDYTSEFVSWNSVILEKLTDSPHFMEPENSLTCRQVPATCPCPEQYTRTYH